MTKKNSSQIKAVQRMVQLDLPEHFDIKVQSMLLAMKTGRAAHKAKNIKASGTPLEKEFRLLLSESLPSTSKVASGYFYGASSLCSGEIDVLVYDDHEAFRLDTIARGQPYVPYTSVSILGQIKNSTSELPGAIEQVQKSLKSWHEMKLEVARTGATLGSPHQFDPLTFIVCGECTKADRAKLATTLQEKGPPFVDYILFLDLGEIIAGDNDFFKYDDPSIDFLQYRNANTFHLCKPDGGDVYHQGVALLWLYFALVSKLSLDQGNNLRYNAFCKQIMARFPLRPTTKLVDSNSNIV